MNKNKISSLIKLVSLMLFFLYNIGEAKQLEKVSVQFHWLDQFEFAGFYMAKEKGYYKDIDLDVEFKNYKYGINITEEVESGNSTFGVGGSDLIINISNNKKIKLLYATFQSSPLVLLTTPMSGIKSIKDFKNKRIMITPDVASSVTFNAMMKKENLNINDLKVQEHSFNVNDLIVQKTDLFQSYISNEPYVLKEQGIKPIIFDPKDYGFDFYCDIIFTSDNEIKNNKQRALNFKEATLKGWQYAFNNIDETVNIILEKYNSQNKTYDALKYEANTLKQMAYENNQPLGNISLNKIQRMYDAYNIMNLIENEIDLEKIIVKDTVNYEVLLSKEEKDYLHQKGVITMCIDPQLMPFEGFDKSGNHIGISADYFKLFQKYVDIPIKIIKTSSWNETLEFLKQRKCDIVSLSMATQERKRYLNFTDTYVETPLILASRLNTYFIDDFSILKNEKIGITKGYGFIDIIKQKYPNLNIIEVQNIEDGLQQVSDGKIFGYIGALGSIGYMFQKEFMGEIKVAGKLDETLKLSIGVRNDDDSLLKIFDKLVKGIDISTKQKILNS